MMSHFPLHSPESAPDESKPLLEGAQQQLNEFLAAGYQPRQVLEVILAIGQKVMSNYTNHLAQTPLDDSFKPFAG